MDPFSDTEWFDDDLPLVSPSEESPSSTEVPTDSVPPPVRETVRSTARRLPVRWPACLATLLILVLLGWLIAGTGSPSPVLRVRRVHHRHTDARRHRFVVKVSHVRSASTGPRVASRSARSIVNPPIRRVERPSESRDVGIERPNPGGGVGNTEQFAYLGR